MVESTMTMQAFTDCLAAHLLALPERVRCPGPHATLGGQEMFSMDCQCEASGTVPNPLRAALPCVTEEVLDYEDDPDYGFDRNAAHNAAFNDLTKRVPRQVPHLDDERIPEAARTQEALGFLRGLCATQGWSLYSSARVAAISDSTSYLVERSVSANARLEAAIAAVSEAFRVMA